MQYVDYYYNFKFIFKVSVFFWSKINFYVFLVVYWCEISVFKNMGFLFNKEYCCFCLLWILVCFVLQGMKKGQYYVDFFLLRKYVVVVYCVMINILWVVLLFFSIIMYELFCRLFIGSVFVVVFVSDLVNIMWFIVFIIESWLNLEVRLLRVMFILEVVGFGYSIMLEVVILFSESVQFMLKIMVFVY